MIKIDESHSIEKAIMAGNAVAIYEADYRTAAKRYSKKYPFADFWYKERNGDSITLFVPKGTPIEELPKMAKGYIVSKWDKHDD
jgi:hypothetical protein